MSGERKGGESRATSEKGIGVFLRDYQKKVRCTFCGFFLSLSLLPHRVQVKAAAKAVHSVGSWWGASLQLSSSWSGEYWLRRGEVLSGIDVVWVYKVILILVCLGV